MPRSATDRGLLSSAHPHPSEEKEHIEAQSVRLGVSLVSGEGHGESEGRTVTSGNGPKLWSAVVLSVLGSAMAVTAAGCFCALLYPILKDLRAERVKGQNGAEERMLGFWSILVLSVLVGCICCVFSWILTYLDSQQPGIVLPSLVHLKDHRHMGYGVAILNGIMGLLTVIWSLT